MFFARFFICWITTFVLLIGDLVVQNMKIVNIADIASLAAVWVKDVVCICPRASL